MGHLLKAKKDNFLFRGAEADEATGRPRQFNVNPWSWGLPGVAQGRYYTRASAYTAHAAASIIFGRFLSAARAVLAALAKVCFQSSPRALDCRIDGARGTGD